VNIGRNDPCYCGSGKKFKKCHKKAGVDQFPQWRETAATVAEFDAHSSSIIATFFAVLNYIDQNDWAGACHAASSVLFVLLREQNVPAQLWLGEALEVDHALDHSWITVDGAVYDVSIYLQLKDAARWITDSLKRAPVFRGIDLLTGEPTHMRYGIKSGHPDGPFVQQIKRMPWTAYMNSFPGHPMGLWGVAAVIGESMRLKVHPEDLKVTYADVKWTVV